MADITEETIIEALTAIRPPDSDKDIVSLGMISGVVLRDGNIAVTIEITQEQGNAFEPTRRQAEETLAALPGVLSATVVLTAQRPAQGASPGAGPGQEQAPLIPNVKTIIAIASGKGGVGKSTTAVNLALAFAAKGLKTGLLDSDIYGPSIPRMLGLEGRPEQISETRLAPKEKFGIKAMSMGLLVADDTPMIWRGPMVMSAIEQMLRDVEWGELDVMVIDLPPGTGDAQLTLAQRVPLTGAVIVSTPQDVALSDARKGLNMFRKVEVPVLGIIENMSYFACPHCGERTDIFSHGGAKREAARM
ncbi:MAG: Mrp/NBP35 family ATP-binding protein, partial [Rhodospirillaceae bacterium]|nr:Mrp/NBP35 family ATP-binding protein [Rhodospirillaceae bacterium]